MNIADMRGYTPLEMALGSNIHKPVFIAAQEGEVDIIRVLTEQGADINCTLTPP